jgi:hypothetical protein
MAAVIVTELVTGRPDFDRPERTREAKSHSTGKCPKGALMTDEPPH